MVRLQAAPTNSQIWNQPAAARPTSAPQPAFRQIQLAPAPGPQPKFPAPTRPAPIREAIPEPAAAAKLPRGAVASARDLLARCEALGRAPLVYKFGSADSSTGGLDCSGTIVELLESIGYSSVPRTAYDQYRWLEENRTLNKTRRGTSASKILRDLRPGQLIFWKGTYKTKKPVTHVMVYMGKSAQGQHYMFGARGRTKSGLYGNGVDVFTFNLESNKGKHPIVGFGDIPKLAYLY
ncbi:MAG: cell wall-associated NlpC family hydrolase [Verrucomicrobiales bacterium]|jgi:cell wall-associated NlpC family hydrolase